MKITFSAAAIITIFVVFHSAPSHSLLAGTPGRVVLDGQTSSYPLGRHISILKDDGGGMTIDDVTAPSAAARFVPSRDDSPSFGFDQTVYWALFRIRNGLPRDEEWFLELEYPHMDSIEVYYREKGGAFTVKNAGDIYPFDRREIDYRNFVFSIPVPAGQDRAVYLRFSGKCSKQFPLTLWKPSAFADKIITENFYLGIYYGIILVMILYNLFIFFFIRDRSYLFYVIYIFTYGLVQMAYNGLAFKLLWPMLPAWHNISIPFLIGLAIVWMAVFSQSFLHTREHTVVMHRSFYAIMAVGIGTMAYSLFGDYLTAIESAMKLMVLTSVIIIISAVICMRRGFRPARFFLMAWLFFLCGMILIALNKLNILPIMFITEYANQIGSAIEVTLISVALADRFNIINQEKKEAQLATIRAQEKYKLLVEGSGDIIFSLDEWLNFITANTAIMHHLRINPDTVTSMNFMDLVYDETTAAKVSKELVRQQIVALRQSSAPLSLRVMFKSTIASEPKEMQVRFERVTIEGKNEILGKATGLEDDVLLASFESEQQKFSIGNYLMTAEDVTDRITKNLKRYMDQKQISLIRIALREIVINAIEHGNLGITYQEKSESIMEDRYFEFIAERRQDPKCRDRKVTIEYSLDPERVTYVITDQGAGFDHRNVLGNHSRDANRDMDAHGRGVSMARNIFDSIEYNEKGNMVSLVKKFKKNGLA
ncbi:MAG: ATP-binding protein [Spirochaetes bacterium]|nr:ATP-binding protein [Spirochaetota bacterium]